LRAENCAEDCAENCAELRGVLPARGRWATPPSRGPFFDAWLKAAAASVCAITPSAVTPLSSLNSLSSFVASSISSSSVRPSLDGPWPPA
jgi:hypothetical protein